MLKKKQVFVFEKIHLFKRSWLLEGELKKRVDWKLKKKTLGGYIWKVESGEEGSKFLFFLNFYNFYNFYNF